MKADWQAIWAPKAQMPPKNTGITRATSWTSSSSSLNSMARGPGMSSTMRKALTVAVRVTRSSSQKVRRTRA